MREKIKEEIETNVRESVETQFSIHDIFLVHRYDLPNKVNDGLINRHNKRVERLVNLVVRMLEEILKDHVKLSDVMIDKLRAVKILRNRNIELAEDGSLSLKTAVKMYDDLNIGNVLKIKEKK